jgi:hypothetical protein
MGRSPGFVRRESDCALTGRAIRRANIAGSAVQSAALQAAGVWVDTPTQGVALGYNRAALRASRRKGLDVAHTHAESCVVLMCRAVGYVAS